MTHETPLRRTPVVIGGVMLICATLGLREFYVYGLDAPFPPKFWLLMLLGVVLCYLSIPWREYFGAASTASQKLVNSSAAHSVVSGMQYATPRAIQNMKYVLKVFIVRALLCLAACVLVARFSGIYPFERIPTISGQIIDARNRQPIVGIPITYFTVHDFGFGREVTLRLENYVTDQKGRFHIKGSIYFHPARLFDSYPWPIIVINFTSYGSRPDVQLMNDKSRIDSDDQVPNKAYFPLAVFFGPKEGPQLDYAYKAYCTTVTSDVEIPLIPLLTGTGQCWEVTNEFFNGMCVYMNNNYNATIYRRY